MLGRRVCLCRWWQCPTTVLRAAPLLDREFFSPSPSATALSSRVIGTFSGHTGASCWGAGRRASVPSIDVTAMVCFWFLWAGLDLGTTNPRGSTAHSSARQVGPLCLVHPFEPNDVAFASSFCTMLYMLYAWGLRLAGLRVCDLGGGIPTTRLQGVLLQTR